MFRKILIAVPVVALAFSTSGCAWCRRAKAESPRPVEGRAVVVEKREVHVVEARGHDHGHDGMHAKRCRTHADHVEAKRRCHDHCGCCD